MKLNSPDVKSLVDGFENIELDEQKSSGVKFEIDTGETAEKVDSGGIHSYGSKVSPPITLLQEICSRNGFNAEYQLLSTEGSVHEPTFKVAVTVDDITVTASGQSKKKARHAAAREAIEKLRLKSHLNLDGINFDSMNSNPEPEPQSTYVASTNETNPVGKLQEICMKMRVNPPDYDTCAERGLAHERIFMLSCSIASLDMTTLGEGRSKKLAKRQAAENMLAKLNSSEIYEDSVDPKNQEQGVTSINMDLDDYSHFIRTRRQVTELTNNLDCAVSDLWEDVNIIEMDNVDTNLAEKIVQERFGRCQFSYLTNLHCLLHIYDSHDNIMMTSFGRGKNNLDATRSAVVNAYKLMVCHMRPFTTLDSLFTYRAAAGKADCPETNF